MSGKRLTALLLILCIALTLLPADVLAAEETEITVEDASEAEENHAADLQPDVGTEADGEAPSAGTEPEVPKEEPDLSAPEKPEEGELEEVSAASDDSRVSYPVTGGNIYFDPEKGEIVDCDESVTSAEIPGSINNIQVVEIGNSAFENCNNLSYIHIPDSVSDIGFASFRNCIALGSINIPDNTIRIGDNAFMDCSSLINISIPNSVVEIGDRAFWGCKALESINIPDNVTRIRNSLFRYCSNLSSVNLPDGVTRIEGSAFADCSSLGSIYLPDGVIDIGVETFLNCSSLRNINLPDSINTIGTGAFKNCSSLSGVMNIPDGVLHIIDDTFYNCSSLSNISLPDSVIGIGDSAFYNCSDLERINLPVGVICIEDFAFMGCSGLHSISMSVGLKSIGRNAFTDCSCLTSIIIPDSVTSIGGGAFVDCSSLSHIEISDGVTEISESAFYNCSSLQNIHLSDKITSIGESAFYNCESLSNIDLPDTVTNIGAKTFYGCSSLVSVDLPDGVSNIGKSMFYNCSSLRSVRIPDSVTSISNDAFVGCSSLISINIPGGVADIGDNMFWNCANLKSIEISDGVLRIGERSFCNCTNLENVKIPDSIISIGSRAFGGCSSLESINIPGSVENIGGYAFAFCSRLNDIKISDGVKGIDDGSFESCSGLESIHIPESVTVIGRDAFAYCDSLESINVPGSVTDIGDCAFSGCNSLKHAEISDGVSCIMGYGVFSECGSLESIDIPDSMISIGNEVFKNCSSLKDVYYAGSEEQWRLIQWGDGGRLQDCTVHYNIIFRKTKIILAQSNMLLTGKRNILAAVLTVQCTHSDMSGTVRWRSSNPAVFSLTGATGKAYAGTSTPVYVYGNAVSEGTTAVTVQTDGGASTTFDITVSDTAIVVESVRTVMLGGESMAAAELAVLCAGEDASGTVSWQSGDPAVFELTGASEAAYSGARTELSVTGRGLKMGRSTITVRTGTGVSKSFEVWVSGSVLRLSEWNAQTRSIRFYADGLDSIISPYVVTDSSSLPADLQELVGEYVLVTAKPGEDGRNREIGSIQPVTSKVGRLTKITDAEAVIDGSVYPLDMAINMGDHSLGEDVIYHLYQDRLIGVRFLNRICGTLEEWNFTKRTVTIDRCNYQTNSLTNMDFLANILQMLDLKVICRSVDGLVLDLTVDSEICLYAGKRKIGIYKGDIGKADTAMVKADLTFAAGTAEMSWTWSTSDSSIVAFDPNGKESESGSREGAAPAKESASVTLYGRKSGTAEITCTLADGTEKSIAIQVFSEEEQKIQELVRAWQDAYQQYNQALEQTLGDKVRVEAKSEEDRATFRELADRLEKDLQSKYGIQLGYVATDEARTYFCRALLEMFATETSLQFALADIDVGNVDQIPTKIVKEICKKIAGSSYIYKEGDAVVTIQMTNAASARFGSASYRKGRDSATMVITSTVDKTSEIVQDYMLQVLELDRKAANQTYKELYTALSRSLFGKSPGELVKTALTSKVRGQLDKLKGFGFGDVGTALNSCYNFYSHTQRLTQGDFRDPEQVLNSIQNIEFRNPSAAEKITEKAVNKAMDALETTQDDLVEALEAYVYGKPVSTKKENWISKAGSFFSVLFQCPVSVEVYDSTGKQVGYVGDDGLWYDDSVYIRRIGETKAVYSSGGALSFKLTGTDYGMLNCTFEEYADGNVAGRTNYYDIPLYEGKDITADIGDAGGISVSTQDAPISSDEKIESAQYELESVDIVCDTDHTLGGELLGGGRYVRGDAVAVSAVADEGYRFQAWMDDKGALLSVTALYEFTARDNMTLTALFVKDTDGEGSVSAVLLESEGSTDTVQVEDPSGVLEDGANVIAACYEDGRMTDAVSGSLAPESGIVCFSKAIDSSWILFFLDSGYAPLCGKVFLRE